MVASIRAESLLKRRRAQTFPGIERRLIPRYFPHSLGSITLLEDGDIDNDGILPVLGENVRFSRQC
jgi:hypothetical protein